MTHSGWYDPQQPPPPKRRGRRRPRWGRRVVLAVVAGFLLVVVQHSPLGDWSVGERSLRDLSIGDLLGGDDDPDPKSFEAEWQTLDGSSYRMTVTPTSSAGRDASPEGCLPAPEEGRANLGFEVRIENRSGRAAPMPEVLFAVNASADGELDRSAEAQAGTNRPIEVTPRGPGVACDDAAAIRPAGREDIPKGETVTLHGTVGGIVVPVPDGLELLIRYIQVDELHPDRAGTAGLRAPFPADEE